MPTKRSRKASNALIQPRKGHRRYLRRNKPGQFKKEVNVGRSLGQIGAEKPETKVAKGQGDRADTERNGNLAKRLVRKLTDG